MVYLQPSSERRPGMEELPTDLRRRLERALGGHIVNISHSSSGASPGWAASLVGANGERAFLKAILNDAVPSAVRRLKIESKLLEWMPSYSFIPTIIDVARTARWTSVLMEDVNGKHPDLRDSRDADYVMTQVIDHLGAITPPELLQLIQLALNRCMPPGSGGAESGRGYERVLRHSCHRNSH